MDAAVHKVTSGFASKVVFAVGLSFFYGLFSADSL
jgi:hypothetical protein